MWNLTAKANFQIFRALITLLTSEFFLQKMICWFCMNLSIYYGHFRLLRVFWLEIWVLHRFPWYIHEIGQNPTRIWLIQFPLNKKLWKSENCFNPYSNPNLSVKIKEGKINSAQIKEPLRQRHLGSKRNLWSKLARNIL